MSTEKNSIKFERACHRSLLESELVVEKVVIGKDLATSLEALDSLQSSPAKEELEIACAN